MVNMEKAKKQHDLLTKTLVEECRLQHINFSSAGLPDSVFIEDTAVIVDSAVLITRPGAESRRPETDAIKQYFQSNSDMMGRKVYSLLVNFKCCKCCPNEHSRNLHTHALTISL